MKDITDTVNDVCMVRHVFFFTGQILPQGGAYTRA